MVSDSTLVVSLRICRQPWKYCLQLLPVGEVGRCLNYVLQARAAGLFSRSVSSQGSQWRARGKWFCIACTQQEFEKEKPQILN